MKVTVENKKGLNKDLKIFIDKETMNSYMDEKYEEIKGSVNLKGFRPGKVPKEILKRQFGKAVFGEVLDKVLKETSTKALEEKKILAKAAQGQVDSGLQFYNDAGELEAYYLPTLKDKVSGGYKQKDYMQESRMQLGQILQDLQGEKAKGILKAINESPKNWQNKVIDLLETASQKDNTEDGGFTIGYFPEEDE